MKNNKVRFSMEDFEKGLMLLGLVSPSSLTEIKEKEALDELDKSQSKEKSEIYFKRAVLAAEIVSKLREEITFGRIKFQKLVYLCEHVAEMSLTERYAKQAAGPFDNKFMHSINTEFKKQKWFDNKEVTDGKYKVQKYFPLENNAGYRQYYSRYFSEHDEHIQFVIELFRKKKTDDTELAATLLACILELKRKDENIIFGAILELFYDWHDKKKRFTRIQVVESLKWLREIHIIPNDVIISDPLFTI